MTIIAESKSNTIYQRYIDIILDELIAPSAEGWPGLREIFEETQREMMLLTESDLEWLTRHGARLAALDQEDRPAALQALERAEPGPFGQVLGRLYALYYSAPKVAEKLRALAQAVPDPGPAIFERDLLSRVIATGAGRRRF